VIRRDSAALPHVIADLQHQVGRRCAFRHHAFCWRSSRTCKLLHDSGKMGWFREKSSLLSGYHPREEGPAGGEAPRFQGFTRSWNMGLSEAYGSILAIL
jgi:hypothetical protein